MARVVSLIGFMPPPRYDTVPWVSVIIEEAAANVGPWAQIDDQVISDPDPDPSQPQARNFTTSLALLEVGWYRVYFEDAFGGTSEPSDAVSDPPGEVLPPTADAIRNLSPLLRKKFPLPPADQYALADLRNLVDQATALVQAVTWRLIDAGLGCSAPQDYQCEAVTAALIPVAFQAVARMSERIYVTTVPSFAEQIATGRRLRGFSAGPYSEQYFAPGEFARRGAQQGRAPMDSDDALDAALWALATEDARDYFIWRATGVAPPTGVVTSFDYRRQSIGYGMAGAILPGAHGGPDGL